MDKARTAVATADGVTASLAGLAALLAALVATVGVAPGPAMVGFLCGVGLAVAVIRGADEVLRPADLVTLLRATLSCAVAALVVDSFLGDPAALTLVVLTTLALVLDAVDGRVARRSGVVSSFGGRFDGEADAFLMLVLSVYLAPLVGAWVLAIGMARYAFGAAGWWLPWMQQQLPFRYWRKVVTAVQGIVLTVAVAGVLPDRPTVAALLVALALLTESFGRDVWWLWQRRSTPVAAAVPTGLAQP